MEIDEKTPLTQILMLGGWVLDIADGDFNEMKAELFLRCAEKSYEPIEFEDLYGNPTGLVPSHFVGYRHWSPKAAEVYKAAHTEDKGFEE